MAKDATHWNERYTAGSMPWDSGIRSRELAKVLEEENVAPCRAVELGCGTGTNALFLAEAGFDVTAIDISKIAIAGAKKRAATAGLPVKFITADLTNPAFEIQPFDFIFDRGCYHCVRLEAGVAVRNALVKLSKPGTRYLLLTGNANEPHGHEPHMQESEIRDELGTLFEIHWIRDITLEDAAGVDGPRAWSCWMTRR